MITPCPQHLLVGQRGPVDGFGVPGLVRGEEGDAQCFVAEGERHFELRGGTEAYLAWSEQPLAKGTEVLVFNSRGERAVDVMEWSAEDPVS